MEWLTPKLVMLGLGVVFELVGLGMVALENRDIGHVFKHREGRAFPTTARARIRAFGAVVSVSGEEPPTIEQRLEKLEAAAKQLSEDVSRGLEDLKAEMRKERAADLSQMQEALSYEIGAVRKLLGVTVAPTRRRWLGLLAFALGLILQTMANLLP